MRCAWDLKMKAAPCKKTETMFSSQILFSAHFMEGVKYEFSANSQVKIKFELPLQPKSGHEGPNPSMIRPTHMHKLIRPSRPMTLSCSNSLVRSALGLRPHPCKALSWHSPTYSPHTFISRVPQNCHTPSPASAAWSRA